MMIYVVSVNLGKLPRQVKLILALRPSFIMSEKALMHFSDNIQSKDACVLVSIWAHVQDVYSWLNKIFNYVRIVS